MVPPLAEPDLLHRKPGTVTAAQALLWIQFSLLLCCGGSFGALVSTAAGLPAGWDRGAAWFAGSLIAATALVLFGYGLLATKLGSGRRWTQVGAISLSLASVVPCVLASGGELALLSGWPGAVAAGWIGIGSATVVCLCTGSAMQWFRQGGWEPWRRRHYPGPPRPY